MFDILNSFNFSTEIVKSLQKPIFWKKKHILFTYTDSLQITVNTNNGKSYHIEKSGTLNPSIIKKIVSSNNLFAGGSQQDSSEFIIYFLDIIEKLSKNKNIYQKFYIKQKTIIKCKVKNCNNISKTENNSMFLILPIKNDNYDLDDCYRSYKKNEKLDGDDRWFCDKCNKKRMASKKIEISEWGNSLIIKLNRFIYNNNGAYKNNKKINCPINWRHNFTLKGGIVHYGGVDGGHYIYFGKYLKFVFGSNI